MHRKRAATDTAIGTVRRTGTACAVATARAVTLAPTLILTLTLALTTSVALAGCGSDASGTTIVDVWPSPTPACDLTADLVKLPGAAAGTTYWDLVVTNRGKTACVLSAAPRLALLNADHEPLPIRAEVDPTAKPFPLDAGASAALLVRYGTTGTQPCAGETAYLRITPPDVDLGFRAGATHCADDAMSTATWTAGKYAAPQ